MSFVGARLIDKVVRSLKFDLQQKCNGGPKEYFRKKEGDLTVVTPLPVVHRVLLERELLQIGVGLGQQADEEEARAGAVEGRHRLRRERYFVAWRIDYYHRQADDVHPHGLRTVNAPFDITPPRGGENWVAYELGYITRSLYFTWNVQNTAKRITLLRRSSNLLSRPILMILYRR